jgi:tyrosyl-tRNA synthetase
MSKSLGNAIGIKDPAPEMYGKLMSINDELMWKYWIFLTDRTQSEIDAMRESVATGALHPMQAKKNLAHSITADFHSAAEATAAAENWATQFQQKGVAEDLPEVTIPVNSEGLLLPSTEEQGKMVHIATLLVLAGLAASKGEATRKLNENAVSINSAKFSGKIEALEILGKAPTLRLGKKSVRVNWAV